MCILIHSLVNGSKTYLSQTELINSGCVWKISVMYQTNCNIDTSFPDATNDWWVLGDVRWIKSDLGDL